MVSTAARVGSINVLLSTQLGPGMAGLNAFASAVDKTGATVSRRVAGIDRTVHGLNSTLARINSRGLTGVSVGALNAKTTMDQLRGAAMAAGIAVGGLVPAAIAAGMIRTTDAAHRLTNQLKTVTSGTADLKNTQEALFSVAQRTRSSFEATTTIYARTARATEHLGLSQQKLLRITETVQKSFAIGGASAQEAQGAAIQLSQGIASNRFSGDEFRSVAENAPVLLRGMAESLGVNIGKLREMAHAGELTAAVVTKAILDASQRIDEEFAKTTSTIEQAWVKVGNAVTKYTMDSAGASAASLSLVTVLNALSDNIDTVADSLLLLGTAAVAVFGGRMGQNVGQWVAGLRAARVEALAAAQANQILAVSEMKAARAEFLQRRLAFNKALNDATLSAKQLERQKKALAASSASYRAATRRATLATEQLSSAQRAASASGMLMAASGRAISAAFSFAGGPLGVALLALGGIMYLHSQHAATAQERSERYADAIKKAGENSTGASPGIQQVAKDLFSVGAGATAAERAVSLAAAKTRELQAMRAMFASLEQVGIRGGWGFRQMYDELAALYQQFRAGGISVEDFLAKTNDIARQAPGYVQPFIKSMEDAARETAAARGEISAVGEQIDKLDGKEAKITITIGTRTVELNDGGVAQKTGRLTASDKDKRAKSEMDAAQEDMRYNMQMLGRSGWDDLFKFPKDKKPKKASAPRKTADDRFDNSVQAIQGRIEALRLEREVVGASFYEQTRRQEALKLEQEALKHAREEARKKGEVDWQSAQISKEKRKEIDEVSTALAAEADMTRLAIEAHQDFEEWMNVGRDATRGFIDDLLNGVSAGEAFANVLKKIGDQLINLAMNDLFGKGGNSGYGLIGQLFGFGGGINYGALSASGNYLFSDGGFTGSGGKYDPAGIVHAGEFVINREAVRNIGVDNLYALQEAATRGFSSGGHVGDIVNRASQAVGGSAERAGGYQDNRVFKIDARGAQVGVAEQITRALKSFSEDVLPVRVNQIASDPYARG